MKIWLGGEEAGDERRKLSGLSSRRIEYILLNKYISILTYHYQIFAHMVCKSSLTLVPRAAESGVGLLLPYFYFFLVEILVLSFLRDPFVSF